MNGLLILSSLVTATVLGAPPKRDKAAEIIAGVEKAIVDPNEYLRWRPKFRSLSKDDLERLLAADNDTVAITAAWETYVRRPSTKRAADRAGRVPVTEREVAAFAAFIEGRLRVAPPDWYRETLKLIRVVDDWSTCYPEQKELVRKLGDGHFTIKGNNVEARDGSFVLHGPDRELSLSKKRLEEVIDAKSFVFASEKGDFYVAGYYGPYMTTLAKLNADGVPAWKSDIWNCIPKITLGGAGFFHLPFVALQGDRVYVIGVGSGGAHIEGFNKETGNPELRFISSRGEPKEE